MIWKYLIKENDSGANEERHGQMKRKARKKHLEEYTELQSAFKSNVCRMLYMHSMYLSTCDLIHHQAMCAKLYSFARNECMHV